MNQLKLLVCAENIVLLLQVRRPWESDRHSCKFLSFRSSAKIR